MPIIRLEDVSLYYGAFRAVQGRLDRVPEASRSRRSSGRRAAASRTLLRIDQPHERPRPGAHASRASMLYHGEDLYGD